MLIDFAASLLTFALRRALADASKREAVILRAREIAADVVALLDKVQPLH